MSPTSKKTKKAPIIEQSSDESNDSKSKSSGSSRQFGRVNRLILDKDSEEYKKRRERNNMAVKKSRTKSKLKTIQTMQRVDELKAENEKLQTKVKVLSKELSFLKDLFLAHAGSAHNGELDLVNKLDLGNKKNGDDEDDDDDKNNNVTIKRINGPTIISSNVISSTALKSSTSKN